MTDNTTDKATDDDLQDLHALVMARRTAEAASVATAPEPISSEFIEACQLANNRGDGTLFAELHRGKFIYNKSGSEWLCWTGHHWKLDDRELRYIAVDDVPLKYLEEAYKISDLISTAAARKETDRVKSLEKKRGYLYSRARLLRGDGADKCLTWSHRVEHGLSAQGDEFDAAPWLLACKNGVIELKTGRFRDGRPDDFLIKAVPHEWPADGIDCPAPVWLAFLNDVFAGDTDLIAYVQRLFGYALTGLTREHIFPVFHGEGSNGKSTLIETLSFVLGSLAQPIPSEMLLDQRSARSSAGPSPDIMSLRGLRFAFASETDENRRFSPSKVKWLSGGDSLTGRNLHDKYPITFRPTHLLCLLTNHLPHAPGDDFAFWRRTHLVPFRTQFVEDPSADNERKRDKLLPDKLQGEAQGILAWLVQGCLAWQAEGLNPPLVVRSATEQYRLSEDLLAEFLAACCAPEAETTASDRVQYSTLYKAFEAWFTQTCGDKAPKKKKFSTLMEKRFTKDKTGGTLWFYGVRLLDTNNDYTVDQDNRIDQDLPF